MRKFAAVLFVLTVIIILSSCSIDDSNDIEVIKPVGHRNYRTSFTKAIPKVKYSSYLR
ncbi:hypothetical protein [Zobellia laminariae]|uniref:hypothetical protein n=1 Tax=Zobellia laminariae TaxID=248906 RepID=UPI0026F45230|nr:hypothetical protein [Zobellia laminariae]WKX74678.1 hypothetical protein Q5W13_12745 [Zobellia laminariae]